MAHGVSEIPVEPLGTLAASGSVPAWVTPVSACPGVRLVFPMSGRRRPTAGGILAEKKPKTPEELAALVRQVAAKGLDRRFHASGLSQDEIDTQELAKRQRQRAERKQRESEREQRETERHQRLRDLGAAVEIQRDGAPDPRDVAHALTLQHREGKPVKLAALLVESGLADAAGATSDYRRNGRRRRRRRRRRR